MAKLPFTGIVANLNARHSALSSLRYPYVLVYRIHDEKKY
jgi:hypothetical protein